MWLLSQLFFFGKNNKPRKNKKWKHCSNYRSDILLLNFNNRTKACIYVYMSVCCVCKQRPRQGNERGTWTVRKWNAEKTLHPPNWMIEETPSCIWEPNMVNHNSRPIWSGIGKGQQQRHYSRVTRKGNEYHQEGIRGLWNKATQSVWHRRALRTTYAFSAWFKLWACVTSTCGSLAMPAYCPRSSKS